MFIAYGCTESSRGISHGTALLYESTETKPTVLSSGKKANLQQFSFSMDYKWNSYDAGIRFG